MTSDRGGVRSDATVMGRGMSQGGTGRMVSSASSFWRKSRWSSTTLSQGLEKINTGRGHNCTPLCALSPIWEKEFLVPSMALALRMHLILFGRLDRNDTLDEVPRNKKQKIATLLFHDRQTPTTRLSWASIYRVFSRIRRFLDRKRD